MRIAAKTKKRYNESSTLTSRADLFECESFDQLWPGQKCDRCLKKGRPCSEIYRIRKTQVAGNTALTDGLRVTASQQTALHQTAMNEHREGDLLSNETLVDAQLAGAETMLESPTESASTSSTSLAAIPAIPVLQPVEKPATSSLEPLEPPGWRAGSFDISPIKDSRNSQHKEGPTTLQTTAWNEHHVSRSSLLERRAQNSQSHDQCVNASANLSGSDQSDVIQMLLERGTSASWHPLHDPALGGYEASLRSLMTEGVSMSTKAGLSGSTSLPTAFFRPNGAAAANLLRRHANPHIGREDLGTALVVAFAVGYHATAYRLIECGADVKAALEPCVTALCGACGYGNHGLVRLLLENGLDQNTLSDLCFRENELHAAIGGRKEVFTTECYESIPNRWKTKYGSRTVWEDGHVAAVQLLVDKGIDLEQTDHLGQTPLYHAVKSLAGNSDGRSCDRLLEIVQMLLRKGANANASPTLGLSCGEPPLFVAIRTGQYRTIKLLLQHGANINYRSHWGQTPIFLAVLLGHVGIVSHLLKNGADTITRNGAGMSARAVAQLKGHDKGDKNIVKLLDDHERRSKRIALSSPEITLPLVPFKLPTEIRQGRIHAQTLQPPVVLLPEPLPHWSPYPQFGLQLGSGM